MKFFPFPRWLVLGAVVALASSALAGSAILDAVIFGEASSETNHSVDGDHSSMVAGGLGTTARKLLTLEGTNWQGGRVAFTYAV